jgi:hypothetical protein
MFGDRDADKNNQPRPTPGESLRPKPPARHNRLSNSAIPVDGAGSLWVDRLQQGISSALGHHSGGGRCRVPSHQ